MNLSLHAFLFANSKAAMQATIKTAETSTSKTLERSLQLKRNSFFSTSLNPSGIPPLRKLHNLAVQIRSSFSLFRSWKSAIGVALGIDRASPWKCWFKLIDALLQHRPAISIWLMEHIDSIKDNHLEEDDWDLLQNTNEFLEVFYQATLKGRVSTFSNAMMTLDVLIVHCRQTRVSKIICLLTTYLSNNINRRNLLVIPECVMLLTWLFLFSISTIATLELYRHMSQQLF